MSSDPAPARGEYAIDTATLQPYEAAALVLTLLTYPPSGDLDQALDQRFGEICAYVLRRRAQRDPAWTEEHQSVRPMHAFIAEDRVADAGRRMATELAHRLAAGRMAIPFIDQSLLGSAAARLPPGAKRLSLNEVAAYVAGPDRDASNLEARSFRPSHPVLLRQLLQQLLAGCSILNEHGVCLEGPCLIKPGPLPAPSAAASSSGPGTPAEMPIMTYSLWSKMAG